MLNSNFTRRAPVSVPTPFSISGNHTIPANNLFQVSTLSLPPIANSSTARTRGCSCYLIPICSSPLPYSSFVLQRFRSPFPSRVPGQPTSPGTRLRIPTHQTRLAGSSKNPTSTPLLTGVSCSLLVDATHITPYSNQKERRSGFPPMPSSAFNLACRHD